MDVINFGRMTKKKQQQNVPVGQSAVAKVVGGASKVGKSREQAVQGVTQGNRGWESQYQLPQNTPNQSPQRNAILNSLMSSPSFTMPKIQHSLLTNEGFNEALGVVGARNRAKLDMQNRRVLGGVLGSLISSDTQKYGADQRYRSNVLNNQTIRRGQDLTAEQKANALDETKAYHKILGDYYQGQNDVAHERNTIAAHKAAAAGQPKQLNPLDAQIKRQKLVESGAIQGMLGADQYNALSDEQQKNIIGRYIQTGDLPTLSGGATHWYGDKEPTITYSQHGQTAQGQQVQQQQEPQQKKHQEAPIATGKLFDALASKYKTDRSGFKLSDDGKSIIFPDGSSSPLENVQRGLGL